MLKVIDLHVQLAQGDKEILHGINLEINPGETHLLRGKNGSGKTTLASVLSGDPRFETTKGKIELIGEKYPEHILDKAKISDAKTIALANLSPDKRSLLGVFLANQYPPEIPGVNLSHFLRLAYNARQKKDMPVFEFRKMLKERAAMINYPEELLDRNLNEGFSGGEKKKTEILQLAVLEPRYAILDETDSGLDQQAIKDVFRGLKKIRETILPDLGLLIITHYERVSELLSPDIIHEMKDGKIAKQSI